MNLPKHALIALVRTWVGLGLIAFGLISPLLSQSSVRGWGAYMFDTESVSATVVDIGAGGSEGRSGWVLLADGRVIVQGSALSGGGMPVIGPGLGHVRASVARSSVSLLSDGSLVHWGRMAVPPPVLPAGLAWVEVMAGFEVAFALRSDGAISAWGSNSYGHLNVPALSPGLAYVGLSSACFVPMALVSDGTIRAWGYDPHGFANVPALPPGERYTAVSSGGWHALALRTDGRVVSWGDTSMGQGNVPGLPPGTHYTAIAASWHSLALRSDGQVVAWGRNDYGQCNVPALPPGMSYIKIAAGHIHSMALRSDGAVVWWGDEFGFVRAAPNLAQQRYFTQAAVGGGYVIAMDSGGQLIHWGASNHGQGLVPGLPAGVHALACDAGIAHSAAVGSDGSVIAWGNNQFGQSAVPQLPPGVTYTKVRCGPFSTVAFRSDGGAVLFGNNDRGQCNAPPALPPGVRYVDAGASYHVSVLLRSDGLTVSLGDSSRPEFHVPQLPSGLRYEQLVITHNSGVGLRSDGRLQYWGSSLAGREPPLPVGVSYVEIAGWDAVLAARRSDGSVVAWTALPGWNFDAPPLAPGTSYIDVSAAVDVVAGVVGPTSTYVSFASGCPGSTAVPQLVPRDTPRIGRTLPVLISPLPANLAFLVAGWTRLAQPLDLASLGMPGCFVHIQGDAVALVGGVGGIGRFEMAIPNTSALKGLRFHQQALVLDPQAPNPAGAVLSDAADAVIGH